MNSKNKFNNNSIRNLYLFITIFIVCFIFYNSFQSGETSSNTSNQILDLVNNFINILGFDATISGNFIRKLAHFVEFFCFGFFLMLTTYETYYKTFEIVEKPLFLGLLVPVIDEYIQFFTPDRVSAVSDVILDFSGSFSGIILASIFIKVNNSYSTRIKYKNVLLPKPKK
ncbi:MAG: VanZ family protein [bacterium]